MMRRGQVKFWWRLRSKVAMLVGEGRTLEGSPLRLPFGVIAGFAVAPRPLPVPQRYRACALERRRQRVEVAHQRQPGNVLLAGPPKHRRNPEDPGTCKTRSRASGGDNWMPSEKPASSWCVSFLLMGSSLPP